MQVFDVNHNTLAKGEISSFGDLIQLGITKTHPNNHSA